MKLNAIFQGRNIQIVDAQRSGSDLYVLYIDNANSSGPLVSSKFSTSALGTDILVSTSATWIA